MSFGASSFHIMTLCVLFKISTRNCLSLRQKVDNKLLWRFIFLITRPLSQIPSTILFDNNPWPNSQNVQLDESVFLDQVFKNHTPLCYITIFTISLSIVFTIPALLHPKFYMDTFWNPDPFFKNSRPLLQQLQRLFIEYFHQMNIDHQSFFHTLENLPTFQYLSIFIQHQLDICQYHNMHF